MKKISVLMVLVFMSCLTMLNAQTIVINEFMADNSETIADPSGSYDDWIEVYNYGNEPVDIGGLYITDDFAEPMKYQIPQGNDSTIIQPQGFLLLWADEDLEQGVLHTDIKLSKSGEEIAFFKIDGSTLVDSVSFGQQQTDISYGRLPNGAPTWIFFEDPTPGWSNGTTGILASDQDLFTMNPNPAKQTTTIYFRFSSEKVIRLYDINANQVFEQAFSGNKIIINCSSLSKGLYLVSVVDENSLHQETKLIIE